MIVYDLRDVTLLEAVTAPAGSVFYAGAHEYVHQGGGRFVRACFACTDEDTPPVWVIE